MKTEMEKAQRPWSVERTAGPTCLHATVSILIRHFLGQELKSTYVCSPGGSVLYLGHF